MSFVEKCNFSSRLSELKKLKKGSSHLIDSSFDIFDILRRDSLIVTSKYNKGGIIIADKPRLFKLF